ncbi:hypothetical protein QF037_008998 [Streptomyces canus]|uniref:hypothetical protein n=1 Tax=Streptomyces canus TaxID=58343 RepID=UPI00277DF251|nr:hypothetical protein [Streptomyces canus]MDQ0604653.1 hypothetical protein [Streptomyces canus]
MRAPAVTAAVTAVLLAGTSVACGGQSSSREGAPPVASAPPDLLVLRTQESHSGPAPWELGRLPGFSLYGGGRVIVPGEPAGALQTAREFPLSGPQYERIMTDARAAGLGRARTYEDSRSTDASLLRVTLRTTGGVRTTRIAAPEAGGTGSRGELLEYVERLPDAPRGAREFRPTALAVLATSGVSAGSASATPWPLRPLSEGTWTREGRCTVLTGQALTQAQHLARDARQDSRWTSGGSLYAVSFRPLLPDEHTCRDLDVR